MVSATFILLFYSTIASIVVLVLSVLYHGCRAQPSIQDNNGQIDEKVEYEIGLINETVNNDQCSCWNSLELTVLEIIVIGVLSIVGTGLMIKLIIHSKDWITKKTAIVKQRKAMKAERMRKSILEEYRASIPVKGGVQEEKEESC